MKTESSTRRRLLETAMGLIWESSYGLVSVDDICDKAGVKKGSFYHFFPSKSELAVAAFEEHWEQKRVDYDRIFSSQLTPHERFALYAKFLYEKQLSKKKEFGRVCGCAYVSLGSELSTQDERIRQVAERNAERTIRYFESALMEAVADGSLELPKGKSLNDKAREIYAFAIGLLMQAKIQNDVEVLRDTLPALSRLIGFKEPALAAR